MLIRQSGPGIHPPPKWVLTTDLITLTISVYSIFLGSVFICFARTFYLDFQFCGYKIFILSSYLIHAFKTRNVPLAQFPELLICSVLTVKNIFILNYFI